ncbi:hypothetical protein JD844_015173 [Phrynosoma platyrhinos]|uniref:RING-type domain-containing protein n=1 Tax=Phrynosoma platyrhinos TaxID=52577 RepID=A0ABQ7T7E7_PHRPL|nr:hypothetical protein JD844_015173 [Phrynosoma platyrhinos]
MWASCCGLLNEVMGTGAVRGQQPGFGSGANPFRFAPNTDFTVYTSSAAGGGNLVCKSCGLTFSVFRKRHVCCECKKDFCSLCSVLQENLRRCCTCQLLQETAFQRPQLMRLKVKDLRQYLVLRNIPTDTCREKEDLVDLILRHHGLAAEHDTDTSSLYSMRSQTSSFSTHPTSLLGSVASSQGELANRNESTGNEMQLQVCEWRMGELFLSFYTWGQVGRSLGAVPSLQHKRLKASHPKAFPVWLAKREMVGHEGVMLVLLCMQGQSERLLADLGEEEENAEEQTPGQSRKRTRASLSDISSLEDIESLSVRQLKEILARNFVNYSGCCEKWELVEKVSRLYREHEANHRTQGEKPPLNDEDDNLCRICMDAAIDCVLLECGHMVTCTKCGKRMSECPICRQYVVRAVHVFKS